MQRAKAQYDLRLRIDIHCNVFTTEDANLAVVERSFLQRDHIYIQTCLKGHL